MNKLLALAVLCLGVANAQGPSSTFQRWSATTGDVSLSGASTAATVQMPASGGPAQLTLESITVYCSALCAVAQYANATPATTTAGTIQALLPTSNLSIAAPVNFFTASNAGGGAQQGGIIHIPAGGSVVICLSTACGNPQTVSLVGAGTGVNYTASIAAITGTANITFLMETR